jgi:hypothetical protein
MTTYTIYSEGGQELSGGISSELVARRVAQEFANDLVETVYLDTAPSSTDPDDDTDVGEAIEPEADAILRHYGVTMTTGSEGESVSEQALTREAARACVAALTAAGIEASEAPDHDDRSMSWVYVGGAIEPDITADTITDRQIWALRDEAAAAGDEAQVIICDIALTRGLADMIDPGEHRAELRALGIIPEHIDADVRARADCARVIAQARHND